MEEPKVESPHPSPDSPQLSPDSPQPSLVLSHLNHFLPQPIIALPQPISALQPNTIPRKKKRKTGTPSTGKRQPWTIADNELLTKGFLHVSNECIVENAQRSSDFWKRVLKYYTEGEGSGAVRTSHNLRSHWHMIKNNVTSFNNIMIQLRAQSENDCSDDQLKTQAHTMYFEQHNTHFIHEHVWNLVKDEPKWKKETDIQELKKTKTCVSSEYSTPLNANTCINIDDDVDDIPLSLEDYEVDESPHPKGTKMAKAKSSLKGKCVEDVTTKLDNILNKKSDVIEQFNARMTQLLELKEKKLDMEILYKDRSKMDHETLAFHKEQCAMIREKYSNKK
ncbi:hypothetical protein R6Q59_029487 [Mikania micrantha]